VEEYGEAIKTLQISSTSVANKNAHYKNVILQWSAINSSTRIFFNGRFIYLYSTTLDLHLNQSSYVTGVVLNIHSFEVDTFISVIKVLNIRKFDSHTRKITPTRKKENPKLLNWIPWQPHQE